MIAIDPIVIGGRSSSAVATRSSEPRRWTSASSSSSPWRRVRHDARRLGLQQQVLVPRRPARSAGMISYEIPMGLCILVVVLTAGTVGPNAIVEAQVAGSGVWFIVAHRSRALFACTLAEEPGTVRQRRMRAGTRRRLAHRYSSMQRPLLAEYAHLITGSAFFVLLFLGGYHLPFVRPSAGRHRPAGGAVEIHRVLRQGHLHDRAGDVHPLDHPAAARTTR